MTRINGYNLFVGTIQYFNLTFMDLSHETRENTCKTRTRSYSWGTCKELGHGALDRQVPNFKIQWRKRDPRYYKKLTFSKAKFV